ncbi:TPA: hypothetical protein N0F65_005646, partial [Lagenidium giganteum]
LCSGFPHAKPLKLVHLLVHRDSPPRAPSMQFQPPQQAYAKDVTVQITSQGVDNNGIVLGHWKSDVFGCMDSIVPNALMSFFCPGITLAQINARMGFFRFYLTLAVYISTVLCAFLAAVTDSPFLNTCTVIISFVLAAFVARLRYRVRTIFAIPGSACEDCMLATCCGCCTLAQMATHVESYNIGACGFAPRATLEGYTF